MKDPEEVHLHLLGMAFTAFMSCLPDEFLEDIEDESPRALDTFKAYAKAERHTREQQGNAHLN